MKFNARQQAILGFIKSHHPVQTHDLMAFSASQFPVKRATIIRDLNKLLGYGVIARSGGGRSTFYFTSSRNSILEPIDLQRYFEQSYGSREARSTFNFEIFQTLIQELFSLEEKATLNALHHQFIRNLSSYDSQTLIQKEYQRIMIEFCWKSSAIEGNTYSLLSTEALIKESIQDVNKTPEETQMILNHKDAFIETLLNKDRFRWLKLGDIEYVHSRLTEKLNIPRNIRKSAVGIVGTRYKPLDNEHQIREALEKTMVLVNEKKIFYEKAFCILLMLSYIQAFEDGNKRTARMLSNAILLAHHSIPLSYRAVDNLEYKKASIVFYETNNISCFKRIFIDQFEDAVKNYFN